MRRPTITSAVEGTNQSRGAGTSGATTHIDLSGVRCPLSWAKAKVVLETLGAGDSLQLRLDEAKGARDIPRAAEAEGYAVLAVEGDDLGWLVLIQK